MAKLKLPKILYCKVYVDGNEEWFSADNSIHPLVDDDGKNTTIGIYTLTEKREFTKSVREVTGGG